MTPTYQAIFFFNENVQSISDAQFLWIDREWWALIIQFLVGVITASAVIWAANKAVKWSEQNLKLTALRSRKYFLGNLKLLRAGINFYMAVDIGEVDDITTKSETVLKEIREIYSEIYEQKASISALLPMNAEVKRFLDLLLIIKSLLDNEKESPEDNYPAWENANEKLLEVINLIDLS